MTTKEMHEQTATVRIYGQIVKRWWINLDTNEMATTDRLKGRDWWGERQAVVAKLGRGRWVTNWEEYEYTEYRLNGEVKQTGTRQFRVDRGECRELKCYDVAAWDGVRYWRNGARPFNPVATVLVDSFTKPADLRQVMRRIDRRCANAAEIRIRKY